MSAHCSNRLPHDPHTSCEGRTAPAPPDRDRRSGTSATLTVHTETDEAVMIGASAEVEPMLDAMARAWERQVPLRVFGIGWETMQSIQALAESMEYEARWRLSLTSDAADLYLTECPS